MSSESGYLGVPSIKPGMVLEDPSEVTEVLATPQQTGDRYRIRLTIQPGGGPGVRGFGPHTHPGLVETFRCLSGSLQARLGKSIGQFAAGEQLEVPPGVVHGFKNPNQEPAVVDVDMIFTAPGPRPEADLMAIGVAIAKLVDSGRVSRWTGFPPVSQVAVIASAHPEALGHPGVGKWLMPLMASLGRLRGYRPTPGPD